MQLKWHLPSLTNGKEEKVPAFSEIRRKSSESAQIRVAANISDFEPFPQKS